MRKLLTTWILFLGLAILPTVASAVTFTPSVDQLVDFSLLSTTPVNSANLVLVDALPEQKGAEYLVSFPNHDPATALLGIEGNWDLTAFDEYSLYLKNVNENPWTYSLYLEDTYGAHYSSPVSILNGSGQALTLNFDNSFDLANITSFGFNIQREVLSDHAAETQASPVPEPSSMMLLGMGILGLLGFKKKIS